MSDLSILDYLSSFDYTSKYNESKTRFLLDNISKLNKVLPPLLVDEYIRKFIVNYIEQKTSKEEFFRTINASDTLKVSLERNIPILDEDLIVCFNNMEFRTSLFFKGMKGFIQHKEG